MTTGTSTFITIRICSLLVARMNFVQLLSPSIPVRTYMLVRRAFGFDADAAAAADATLCSCGRGKLGERVDERSYASPAGPPLRRAVAPCPRLSIREGINSPDDAAASRSWPQHRRPKLEFGGTKLSTSGLFTRHLPVCFHGWVGQSSVGCS